MRDPRKNGRELNACPSGERVRGVLERVGPKRVEDTAKYERAARIDA